MATFHTKKTPAEKSYVSALCRILVLLHFRLSEQGAVQLMRRLLIRVAESVSAEKDLVKELRRMADHLKALDKHPDQEMLQDQANLIFGKILYLFIRVPWKGFFIHEVLDIWLKIFLTTEGTKMLIIYPE